MPEVQHFQDSVIAHHQVLRLHIAMDDVALMRRRERLGDLTSPIDHLCDLRRLAAELAKRTALHQFHGDRHIIVRVNDLIDRDDVRMIQCGGRFCFADQPFDCCAACQPFPGSET